MSTKNLIVLQLIITIVFFVSISVKLDTLLSVSETSTSNNTTYVTIVIKQPTVEIVDEPIQVLTGKDLYFSYVDDICKRYDNVDPYIIKSMMFKESTFRPNAKTNNNQDVGLMQVSTKWHKERADRLGVTNFTDPYSNILLAVDYMSELQTKHNDLTLSLMLYNMKWTRAFELHKQGIVSDYAKSIIAMADDLRKE